MRSGIEVVLYPNPTQAYYINVRLFSGDENSNVQVLVFDVMGREIHREVIDAVIGESTHVLEVRTKMESGIYHVVVQQGSNQKIERLIIK